MSQPPNTFDWPMPSGDNPQDEAKAGEDVLLLAEDVSVLLTPLPSALRDAFIDAAARAWEVSPSPAESLRHIVGLLGRISEQDRADFAQACLANRQRFRAMFRLMGCSGLVGGWLQAGQWRRFLQLGEAALESERSRSVLLADLASRLQPAAHPVPQASPGHREFELRLDANISQEDILARLRQWHADHTIVIAHHDFGLGWPVERIAREISTLADAGLQAAFEIAWQQLAPRMGSPLDEGGNPITFCVMALGKLGASELNYSSDIDVTFVYSADGRSEGGLRSVDAATWFAKLAETLMKLLSARTEHGQPYRVDARLRPDGSRGPLALSLASTLKYYRTRGTTWERQALLKLRPAAGDIELGTQLVSELQTFVFRRFLSVTAINEIKGLKRQIEHRTEAQDQTWRDVKTGFGGIRDIEFVAQFLQLVNGGRLPAVRKPATLDALAELALAGCLREEEVETLSDAYRLLRRIEHVLQLESGQQTHALPAGFNDLDLVARRLGYKATPAMSAAKRLHHDLGAATIKVRGLLLRLFTGLFDAGGHRHEEADLVLDQQMDTARAAVVLSRYGIKDAARALNTIHRMAQETQAFKRFEPRVRTYLASMLPALLSFVSDSPDPDSTLANFERLTASLGAKGVFYELVAEQAAALKTFGALCAHSGWLVELIESRPGLLDEFIDVLQTWQPASHELRLRELRSQLDARCLASAGFAEGAAWTRSLELLRIGLFDISNREAMRPTMQGLALLAEAILGAAVDYSLAHEVERFPAMRPRLNELTSRFVAIGLGKFGSGAMNYASDLDLVFIHGATGTDSAATAHVEERLFFERAAWGTRKMLAEDSRCYQVDLRLRPGGDSSGAVASSLHAIESYLSSGAQFWERLALTRARVVHGANTPLGNQVTAALERFTWLADLPADAHAMTLDMRRRMEEHAPKGHLKQGSGGLLDVEFAVQWLQLEHGREVKAVRCPGVLEAIEALSGCGAVDAAAASDARDSYLFLRSVENRLQVVDGKPCELVPQAGAELEVLARRMGMDGESPAQTLLKRLEEARKSNREFYRSVMAAG